MVTWIMQQNLVTEPQKWEEAFVALGTKWKPIEIIPFLNLAIQLSKAIVSLHQEGLFAKEIIPIIAPTKICKRKYWCCSVKSTMYIRIIFLFCKFGPTNPFFGQK